MSTLTPLPHTILPQPPNHHMAYCFCFFNHLSNISPHFPPLLWLRITFCLDNLSFGLHLCPFLIPSSNHSTAKTSFIKSESDVSVPNIIYFFITPCYLSIVYTRFLPSRLGLGLILHLCLMSLLLVLACTTISFI